MTRLFPIAIVTAIACMTCSQIAGQTPNGQPSFEVASIKPAAPPQMAPGGRGTIMMMGSRGGPGSPDPGRYQCNNCNLQMLMIQAYGVESYQLSIPSSLAGERYEITAKVPEGTTKDQFKLMLQNLLADRFKMQIHRESKEGQVYELSVMKGGIKMKESAPEPPKEEAPAADAPGGPAASPAELAQQRAQGLAAATLGGRGPLKLDKDGFPEMPKGAGGGRGPMTMMMPGKARMKADNQSMEDLVKTLSRQVGKPVTDLTGLKGKYDFILTWDGAQMSSGPGMGPGRGGGMQFAMVTGGPGPGPGPTGGGGGAGDANSPISGGEQETQPTLFGALQSQLGLKLEAKKGMMELIVVDHAEKTPTEN
jgi:uncharacterized protein (TIGR03435 family)